MSKEKKIKTVWVTKYALIKGIESKPCEIYEKMAVYRPRNGSLTQYFHGKEWHLDADSALKQAESMRTRKIDCLRKQIAKLEQLKFQPPQQ